MSLAWEEAKRADEREKQLKTARMRRPDAHTRRPLIWHTPDKGEPDDVPSANWDWVEAKDAAAFVAFMVLLIWVM